MENTVYNYIKDLNDQLFWKCYRIEKKITSFLCYRFNLPRWRKVSRLLLITSLLFTIIPGTVKAKGKIAPQLRVDLALVNPLMKRVAAEEVKQHFINSAFNFNINADTDIYFKKDISKPVINLATLPKSPKKNPKEVREVVVTFYSSTPDQTDSTPFITADGSWVGDGIAAANFLSFGTMIKVPHIFGDKMFVIRDRMHPRFDGHIDIWVETREEAVARGIKYTLIEIY